MRRTRIIALLALIAVAGAGLAAKRGYAEAEPGRYVVKASMVYDTKTKLSWPQDPGPSTYTWAEAKTYCDTLTLNALKWRVPSVKELGTLVDETRVNPAIDPNAFPGAPAKFFWTSSAVTNFNDNAWVIDFNRGVDLFFPVISIQLVRCVH